MHCFDNKTGEFYAYLVDGYLPDKSELIQAAGNFTDVPFSWEGWDKDAIFEKLAFNARKQFCGNRPRRNSGYTWSEAWLLNPREWKAGVSGGDHNWPLWTLYGPTENIKFTNLILMPYSIQHLY